MPVRARAVFSAGGRSNTIFENALLFFGAVAVAVSAGIHLHLWMDSYSAIHTVGPLFLAQSIAGFVLALTIVVTRRVLPAVLGIGYMLATIAGFLLSVNIGLFGFQDSWSAAFARTAFWDEIAGSIVLLMGAGICAWRAFRLPGGSPAPRQAESAVPMGSGAGGHPGSPRGS